MMTNQAVGLEPAFAAWRAAILPLNDACMMTLIQFGTL